jgi:hypothetical protein
VFGILYSDYSRSALSILAVVMAMLLTWSLLIANVWLGYSGRPAFYYSLVAIGMAGLFGTLYFLVWWAEFPRSRDDFVVHVLPWLPWALAAAISAKVWAAAVAAYRLQSCQLVASRHIAIFVYAWLAAALCLVYGGWLLSPRIEWLRDMLLLAALCTIPLARLVATPLTIAWNRHR